MRAWALRHRPMGGAVVSRETSAAYATGMIVAMFEPVEEREQE